MSSHYFHSNLECNDLQINQIFYLLFTQHIPTFFGTEVAQQDVYQWSWTTVKINRKLSDCDSKMRQSVAQITSMVTYPVAVGAGLCQRLYAQRNIHPPHEHIEQETQREREGEVVNNVSVYHQAGSWHETIRTPIEDVCHTAQTKLRLWSDNRSCHWNKSKSLLHVMGHQLCGEDVNVNMLEHKCKLFCAKPLGALYKCTQL